MKEERWRKLHLILSKYYREFSYGDVENNTIDVGAERIESFFYLVLSSKKKPLERHQFDVLMVTKPILLREAFGWEFYETHRKTLLGLCQCTHSYLIALFVLKRQFGKTELMVRIAGACLLSFPNPDDKYKANEWVLYSHKGEHVKENLDRCKTFLEGKEEFWGESFTCKSTQTYIILKNIKNSTDKRKLLVKIGNVDGLGGKKVFGDEFAAWSAKRAQQQFAPQLQVKATIAWLFTSLKEAAPWFTPWMDRERNKLTLIINKSEICVECIELPYDEAVNCDHLPKLQAHFVDQDRRKAIMDLMPADLVMREMYNSVPLPKGQVWTAKYLKEKFFSSIPSPSETQVNGIIKKPILHYMFVDPSMTSTSNSYTGSTILTLMRGRGAKKYKTQCFVEYINTIPTPANDKIVEYVMSDLEAFFRVFKNAKVVLFVEGNTTSHGYEIQERLLAKRWIQDERVYHMKGMRVRGKLGYAKYGVQKRHGHEELFVQILREYFSQGRIFFHPKAFTRNKQGIHQMKRVLLSQLLNVKGVLKRNMIMIESKKDSDDRPALNDLYISLTSAMHWGLKTTNNEDLDLSSQLVSGKSFLS